MIIATVAAIMFFFGSSENGFFGSLMTKFIEDPIKLTIEDEKRQEKALESLSLLNENIEEFNNQISDTVDKFRSLVSDYNSTPEEFDSLLSISFEKRERDLKNILELRKEMLSHITPDEWQKIYSQATSAANTDE